MLKKEKGFTLIEILTVVSIIALISGIVSVNYRQGARQTALQRAGQKLAQEIRRTQEMAMSSKELSGGAVPSGGYGVYFDRYGGASINYNIYLYSDNNGNECYDNGEKIETIYHESNAIYLEKGIKIKSIAMTRGGVVSTDPPNMSINFMPPEPNVKISKSASPDQDFVIITLALTVDESITRTVFANKVGLINAR